MTDFRSLCAELLKGLDENKHEEVNYPGHLRVVMAKARAALAEQQPPTFLDAIRLAKGSHDYSGGYGGTPCDEAFHAGIGTVVNVLTKAATGPWDYQTKGVFEAGAYQPAADGEVATGPAVQSREPASVVEQPISVSERLPGDQLCWWYEPDEDCGYGGMWTLLRIRNITSCYTHWLPAHALPLPSGEVG
jgi:hypothetical protein